MNTPISMSVKLTVGPLNMDMETNEGDVLHHISEMEFVAKVMELKSYYGPVDDPPSVNLTTEHINVAKPSSDMSTEERSTEESGDTEAGPAWARGLDEDALSQFSPPRRTGYDKPEEVDDDEEVFVPSGAARSRKKLGSKDPVLQQFFDDPTVGR